MPRTTGRQIFTGVSLAGAFALLLMVVFELAACTKGAENESGSVDLDPLRVSRKEAAVVAPLTPEAAFEKPMKDVAAPSGKSAPQGEEDCAPPDNQQEKPRIAIIIDDMGNRRGLGEQLLALDLNLTFSFLPHAPFTKELEEQAWDKGFDVLVHMPMEARDSQWDPGPGTLYINDSSEKLTSTVRQNLALVPHAIGVNNHMGSRFTEDRPAMHKFLGLIRDEELFFIDSTTSSASIGMEEAHEMGIKTARRHVFLDNVHTQEDICRQLKELIRIARKNGWAIGIGHPNEETLKALIRCRETLLENVRVVGIHELIQ